MLVSKAQILYVDNGIYDLCIIAIFSKTGFVDIVPLCCEPLMYIINISFVIDKFSLCIFTSDEIETVM